MPNGSGGGKTDFKAPPRNYKALPVARNPPRGVDKNHSNLEKDGFTGDLAFRIETLTAVHIGTGGFALVDDSRGSERLVKDIMRSNGQPIIPGSSLKGMCRYAFEAITESGEPRDAGESSDRAASVFGSLVRRGFVSFDDAISPENVLLETIWVSGAYPPDQDVGRRFYGPQPEKANQPPRCPALAIPAGVDLETTLHVENLKDFELGWVLLALGIQPRFDPKIGGAKYDSFGWIRVHLDSWSPRRWPEDPKPIRGAPLRDKVGRWSRAGRAMLSGNGSKALRTIKRHMQSEKDGDKP